MTIWKPELDEHLPRYRAIADAIERDVHAGVLAEGDRLPTHRDLAEALGVTVGTVSRGYAEAERRGLTDGEVGRGTFVRSRSRPDLDHFSQMAGQEGAGKGVIDMSLACPWVPPDGEEGRMLATTLTEVARGQGLDELMEYHASSALLRHRAGAARWLARLGVQVSPDQVVVTCGAQHAMTAALGTLLTPGDTVMVGELTYPGFKAVAQMFGLKLRGVPLDGEGIVPEALDELCSQSPAEALYCVPAVQNPTGVTMSEGRRRRIAEVARAHELIVLEDQVHLGPQATPSIASFAPERTVHITSLSKWVSFGLRIGFVTAPDRAVERIRSGVRSTLWMPPPLMTEVAIRWLMDGTAEALAAKKAKELEARHRIVRELLGPHDVEVHEGSLHIWIRLPETLRSDEFVHQARQRSVLIAGAEAFAVGRSVPHAARVSIAMVPHREDFRRGTAILADILDGATGPCVQIV